MKLAYFGYNIRGVLNWGCRSTPRCLMDILKSNIPCSDIETVSNFENIMKDYRVIGEIIKRSDIIVINGEGTPIFKTPPRKDLERHLRIIEISLSYKKKVLYLNTMLSRCPSSGVNKDTLSKALSLFKDCTLITTRDEASLGFIEDLSNSVYIPDALFTWSRFVPGHIDRKPEVILSGGSSPLHIGQRVEEKTIAYSTIVNHLREHYPEYKVKVAQTCNGDKWLESFAGDHRLELIPLDTNVKSGLKLLSECSLFISGRFHPSIMASLGGTPCIHFLSNSDKTTNLQKTLEYDSPNSFEIPVNNEEVQSIYRLIDHYLSDHFIRDRIRTVSNRLSKLCLEEYRVHLRKAIS